MSATAAVATNFILPALSNPLATRLTVRRDLDAPNRASIAPDCIDSRNQLLAILQNMFKSIPHVRVRVRSAAEKIKFRAHFIDFGFCFNAEDWDFPDTPTRGIYARKLVYQDVVVWQSFEPWLSGIESFRLSALRAIAADVPPEWIEPEKLSQLVECIDAGAVAFVS